MSIDVAVIPAAGMGTRMRPATRVVPKALITVVDRPAIQYPVEEAARAGAHEVIVVVDPAAGHLVAEHFTKGGPLPGLEDVEIRTVIQHEALGLGHAVGVAAEAVGGRPFFCLLSDNIVPPGYDVLPALAIGSRDGQVSVMCLRELTDEFLSKYGVVVPDSQIEDGFLDLSGAVEKPGVDAAPSKLGLVGRYLFTSEVFGLLEGAEPGFGGEIQLTDAINTLGANGRLRGWVAHQDLLDVGTPTLLLEASIELATAQFGSEFTDWLDERSR